MVTFHKTGEHHRVTIRSITGRASPQHFIGHIDVGQTSVNMKDMTQQLKVSSACETGYFVTPKTLLPHIFRAYDLDREGGICEPGMNQTSSMSRRSPVGYIQDPMLDGSNDTAALTLEEWNEWIDTQLALDTIFPIAPRHDSASDVFGLAGGGQVPLTGYDTDSSLQDLSLMAGAILGSSGHLSLLSGG